MYHGSSTGLSAIANWTAECNQADAIFGYPVSTAGDVNGDGYSDVIVSAENYDNDLQNEGRIYVYHGSSSGLSVNANWVVEGNQSEAQFGNSVSTAGDVNGDGYSDIIIGALTF
ncbi:MAG: FG-GAP repeat protein [Ignavibacteria bacterium]|nr:FG-GAP repeat protein [Ignavibacteria bacterium]